MNRIDNGQIKNKANAFTKDQNVQSITRAANILKLLSSGGGHSVTNISRELKLSKGTVHRMLRTLEASNFVVQDPISRFYCLGQFIVNLGSNFIISHQNLLIYCFAEMKRLQDISGETISLSVLLGNKRFVLEELPSKQNVKFTMGKGITIPLHTGCAGKVLLAEIKECELDTFIANMNDSGDNNKELIDKETLKVEVKNIRELGYAISFGEVISDAAGISVPIRGYICPACISIFGPKDRFKIIMQGLPELRKAANRISEDLSRRKSQNQFESR